MKSVILRCHGNGAGHQVLKALLEGFTSSTFQSIFNNDIKSFIALGGDHSVDPSEAAQETFRLVGQARAGSVSDQQWPS